VRSSMVASVSAHASRRLAQRNLTNVHLGLRDIPEEDRRDDRLRRLEGTVLVLDPSTGCHLTTAYRNRQRGSRDIRRKLKRALFTVDTRWSRQSADC
jgi:hypothetical protein